MSAPVFSPGRVAVITGGAGGIGFAAARRCAELGMRICLVDTAATLEAAARSLAELTRQGAADVMAAPTDVSDPEQLRTLQTAVYDRFGEVALLMNNAAVFSGTRALEPDHWQRLLAVDLWGVIHGSQIFVPAMIAQGTSAMVVNTGSKQGITTPPGNTAYNVAKAGVKVYTEGLQHELRNLAGCQVTAHLLVPGWTTQPGTEHRPGAWLPEQVVDYFMPALARGDFYIICPDDEVTPALDRKRILWAAGDIVNNRPPLSRWHGDFDEAFDAFTG